MCTGKFDGIVFVECKDSLTTLLDVSSPGP